MNSSGLMQMRRAFSNPARRMLVGNQVQAQASDQGKTVTIVVGTDAGGGFDIYCRAVARHRANIYPDSPASSCRTCPAPAA